jgi:arginyl-tRNA synthetase
MKEKIIAIITGILGQDAAAVELSIPEHEQFGHYSTNVAMRLAHARGKKSIELAKEFASAIATKAPVGFFEKVEAVNPGFINFWLTPSTIQDEFAAVARAKDFGASDLGKKKTVIVEYSQPNIAKMMHVGHLRTTIIGAALANILELSGYKVVRWNYLGDWGTQFGKLIAAYKLWGKKEDVEKRPIEELQRLYVRFHDEVKTKPELERRGQEEFLKLEEGDKENRKLWEWFKKESLKEFEATYKTLGVDFDVWIGESFFEPEMKPLAKELTEKKLLEKSEGALVVKLDAFNLPPALIEKADGASLYLTRDIANLRYRLKKYKPAKILYVVSNEQSLHFEQLFALAKLLHLDSAELTHVKYGLVLGEAGKKLSTREGRTQLLKDVVNEAIIKARKIVHEKSPDLTEIEKKEIADAVALGALKYNDLKENRMTDIVFDWQRMLDFSGDSGPYLQYTYARFRSIIRKAGKTKARDLAALAGESELALMRKLFEFPDAVVRAGELYATSILAAYLYKLAVTANKFYETTPILKDEDEVRRIARILLVSTAADVLKKGLGLLGIEAPEKI